MMRDFTVSMADTNGPTFHNRRGEERWSITCAETGEETGTGGRLWRVRDYIDAETFFFTYGDAVGDVDIDALVETTGRAVELAGEAGFDAVELQAGHGYLISQFLSPGTNQRTDKYGGVLRMRFRFLQEVLAAVQGAVGPDYPVAIKLNGEDFVAGGLDACDLG